MVASPARLLDVVRTVRVVVADVVPMLGELALHPLRPVPSSTTAAGLARMRGKFGRMLEHLAISLEVLHAERVPQRGGVVLMWNQESHLDHLVLGASVPRPFFSIFNNAVARVPFYGEYMRATGHVHVDRRDPTQWRGAIARAAGRVREGECVLISPEGTRSSDGKLLPLKRGALELALAARAPVVCTTVIGGHERMPLGSPIARGGPIRVVFAEPIEPTDDGEELRARIVATFAAVKRAHAP